MSHVTHCTKRQTDLLHLSTTHLSMTMSIGFRVFAIAQVSVRIWADAFPPVFLVFIVSAYEFLFLAGTIDAFCAFAVCTRGGCALGRERDAVADSKAVHNAHCTLQSDCVFARALVWICFADIRMSWNGFKWKKWKDFRVDVVTLNIVVSDSLCCSLYCDSERSNMIWRFASTVVTAFVSTV